MSEMATNDQDDGAVTERYSADEWTHRMDDEQRYVESVTDLLWPGETTEEAALALCEEAGEVARAVIKRNHAAQGSGDREPADWSANLRRELAQVVVVAMKMAEREGFSLAQMVVDERRALESRWWAHSGSQKRHADPSENGRSTDV